MEPREVPGPFLSERMNTVDVLWNAAPGGLRPADGNVHVFCSPLDVPSKRLEELAQLLSYGEWRRANHFYLERDRNRFIAGRGTLREILAALFELNPAHLVFTRGEFGKPHIAAPAAARSLHFNLAHSDAIAVYAIAKHELGVDVERIRAMDDAEQIVSGFFSPREKCLLQALPAEQRREAFFNCWTRKEAYLKAIGSGLNDQLDQIEVSLAPGDAAELLGVPATLPPWRLHSLRPAAEFVGALAIRPEDSHVNCWQWNGPP
ncbi:MAG: 4'-phosphopantetheinyl transferase superfamily protein [Verrucomicrobia bacterium]|nr:4'-phosphopantetheinyl transferase superfamily protein [Verrucomicrobiota bacterium]